MKLYVYHVNLISPNYKYVFQSIIQKQWESKFSYNFLIVKTKNNNY